MGQKLAKLRASAGLSLEQVAGACRVSKSAVSQWESGETAPRLSSLEGLANLYGISTSDMLFRDDVEAPKINPIGRGARDFSDIPVYGAAMGSFSGEEIKLDQPIGFTPRPPHLADVKDATAIVILGDSMSPRYEPREIVFVDPRLPPRIGDYVLVELTGHLGIVKRLARLDDNFVEVESLNPPARRKLKRLDVLTIARIVGSAPGFSY